MNKLTRSDAFRKFLNAFERILVEKQRVFILLNALIVKASFIARTLSTCIRLNLFASNSFLYLEKPFLQKRLKTYIEELVEQISEHVFLCSEKVFILT